MSQPEAGSAGEFLADPHNAALDLTAVEMLLHTSSTAGNAVGEEQRLKTLIVRTRVRRCLFPSPPHVRQREATEVWDPHA